MDRREFLLNTAKASGVILSLVGVVALTNLANAQARTGKLLLYYHCDGGWDTDSFSDPVSVLESTPTRPLARQCRGLAGWR